MSWIKWIFGILMALAAVAGVAFWMRPVSILNAYSSSMLRGDGFSSQWTQVNGIRLHYYVAGPETGAPVVLVHGLGGRAEDWRKFGPIYAKWLFRVYLIDLPGFGQSDRPAEFSYAISDQAEIVKGFMDAVGVPKADLGGWSMGGWIAQQVAIRHPEHVNKLILFNSAGLYMIPSWNVQLFTPATPAELDELDALLMPHPPKVPSFIARDILRTSNHNAWIIHRALDSMLTGKDTTDEGLKQLKMPVLILWGEEDRITPLSEGKRMSQIVPQSQLMTFSGCGHLAPLECADKMASVAVEFSQQ